MSYLATWEYEAIVAAFEKVGAPIFARVALLINAARRAAGKHQNITYYTLRKAWDHGWNEHQPPVKSLFKQTVDGLIRLPTKVPAVQLSDVSNEIESSERSESKTPAPDAGIASRSEAMTDSVNHDAASQTPQAVVATSDEAALIAAFGRLNNARINALLNEMGVQAHARANVNGIHVLLGQAITMLQKEGEPILRRLIKDLASSDSMTFRTYRETLKDLADIAKDLSLTFKVVQESQRLLVGMPQQITEHRRPGEEENAEERGLGRMAGMLRLSADRARAYGGEETGAVIDVPFVTHSDTASPANGEGVVKAAPATTQVPESTG